MPEAKDPKAAQPQESSPIAPVVTSVSPGGAHGTPVAVAAAKVEESPAPTFNKDLEYILVAEDSLPNRTILTHLLRKLGYGVIECTDGQVAVEQIEICQKEGLKLVAFISDIMMPRVDGIELLRRVREHSTYKGLPFLLVSAVADKNFIIEAKKLNVTGYIVKPVTFQRVTEKLKEIFPKKEFPKVAV